jgi:hypothetical protein
MRFIELRQPNGNRATLAVAKNLVK